MDEGATRGNGEPAEATSDNVSGQLDIRALVVEHHADVYRYAYRLCGNQADAEDLAQQTFLVAHEHLGQVRDCQKVAAWLFAILRNCYLKGRRKPRPINATGLGLDVEQIPETDEPPEIDRERLQQALDELPDEFKLVLVMFYFEGCSYKEIAAGLGIPIGTVMSRLARAKSRLRGRLLDAATVADRAVRRAEAARRAAPASAVRPGGDSGDVGR